MFAYGVCASAKSTNLSRGFCPWLHPHFSDVLNSRHALLLVTKESLRDGSTERLGRRLKKWPIL